MEGFPQLVHRHADAPGKAIDEVPPLDLVNERAVLGGADEQDRRSQGELELLSLPVADEEAMALPDVLDDRLVEVIAADPHGLAAHDAGQGHHGDLRRPTTDVYDDMCAGRGHRPAR